MNTGPRGGFCLPICIVLLIVAPFPVAWIGTVLGWGNYLGLVFTIAQVSLVLAALLFPLLKVDVGAWFLRIDGFLMKKLPDVAAAFIKVGGFLSAFLLRISPLLVALFIVLPVIPQSLHDHITLPEGRNPQICGTICVEKMDGEVIGISAGRDHFLTPGDTNNAEELIYRANQSLDQPRPDIALATIVVVAPLNKDGGHAEIGFETLQGAYVLQQEVNQEGVCRFSLPSLNKCVKMRLLVANAGEDMHYSTTIAQQVINVARSDPSFVGTIGWPLSTLDAIEGIRLLTQQKILVISSAASSDALTAISSYFFRIVPPDAEQGRAAAQFVLTTFPDLQRALVVHTPNDPYGVTLANSFIGAFTEPQAASTKSVVSIEYDEYHILNNLSRVFRQPDPPQLIYFAGEAESFGRMLNVLREENSLSRYRDTLPIVSGDLAYDIKDMNSVLHSDEYESFYFTSFAFADEWGATSPGNECNMSSDTPSVAKDFFCGYLHSYDPYRKHGSGSYSYNRQDDHVILGFDALQILFQAFYLSRQEKEQPGQVDIQQVIQQINLCNPYQGVTGQIAFGPAGDPIHKAILILGVSADHTTHLIQIAQGQLKIPKAC